MVGLSVDLGRGRYRLDGGRRSEGEPMRRLIRLNLS